MKEKIERYTRKLEGLSTEELSRSAERLVSLQRRNDAALIAHLVELSRRTGHLELGYRSLFYYCVEHLHLGESSSWKRTQVAGVASRFPQVLEHLAQGKVNLSVLSIVGIENAERRMPEILERALDLALEKKDPQKKLERRRKREVAAAARRETSPEKVNTEEKKRPVGKARAAGSRYIRSSVRERVLERAGYQCEFRGPGGVRCSWRTGLEIDHVDPYAKGGGVGEENLRALCRAHNLFSAAREFGEEFMRGKIEGKVQNLSFILSSA